ncbi:hypothetical protein DL93DRAFT_2142824, partial [Clavulina sp. PMI_390]
MIQDSPDLRGIEIHLPNRPPQRLVVALFADDTTVYLSDEDTMSTLKSLLDIWCLASGAKFNEGKTHLIPVGPLAHRERLAATRKLNPDADEVIENSIHILTEGEGTRILGAHIGNHTDPIGPWISVIDKARRTVKNIERYHPTAEGRAQTSRTIGGLTQYLTAAQGMPKEIEKILHKMAQDHFWSGGR